MFTLQNPKYDPFYHITSVKHSYESSDFGSEYLCLCQASDIFTTNDNIVNFVTHDFKLNPHLNLPDLQLKFSSHF